MKRILLAGIALATITSANADFHITAVPQLNGKNIKVEALSLDDFMNKSRRDRVPAVYNAEISQDFQLPVAGSGAQRFVVTAADYPAVVFYADASDNVNIAIGENGNITVTGTPLLNQLSLLQPKLAKAEADYRKAAEQNDEAAAQKAIDEYNLVLVDYVKTNPSLCSSTWAVLNMDTEQLLEYAPVLTGDATTCILYPLLQKNIERAKERLEAEQRRQQLADDHVTAPDFALPDLQGKTVKLSDFKGKWVVLDFWGSWCPWCIKGFPGLKKVYSQYQGKLEIIGIDCNDPDANWRAAVKKYELPWVNVYNNLTSGGVLEAYAVQAFPTKVLVNPQGKIEKIYVGEDPAFYDDLNNLIK